MTVGELAHDWVVPLRPSPPWFSEELRAMKRRKRRLESRWRSTRSESDRTQVRSYLRTYLVAIRRAKRSHLATLITSADNRPAALFRVTRSLLQQGPQEAPLQGRAEEFGTYLQDKITRIRDNLASTPIDLGGLSEPGLETVLWDEFDFVTSIYIRR